VPCGLGLVVGVGYGLADGSLLSRPYLDLVGWSLRPLGPQPGPPRRRADRASAASPAEGDLPDSSQYGNSSHPPRRMRAVQ
jgi:hypothetical protein